MSDPKKGDKAQEDPAEGYSNHPTSGYWAELPSGRVVQVEEVNLQEGSWKANHGGVSVYGPTRKAAVAALAEELGL